jgi:hypothetical protein
MPCFLITLTHKGDMDTGKVYNDSDGNERTIHQMVKHEPNWAANRIQEGEKAIEKIEKIKDWSKAYPLDVFPEPDFKKAHKILKENGMTLDAISASNMRHVLNGILELLTT